MKNVQYLVHFDPAFQVVDYCQQIGCAERNGEELCHAIMYSFPNRGDISKPMKRCIKESRSSFFRSTLFTPFNENNELTPPKVPGHLYSSFCVSTCDCGEECQPFSFNARIDDELLISFYYIIYNNQR